MAHATARLERGPRRGYAPKNSDRGRGWPAPPSRLGRGRHDKRRHSQADSVPSCPPPDDLAGHVVAAAVPAGVSSWCASAVRASATRRTANRPPPTRVRPTTHERQADDHDTTGWRDPAVRLGWVVRRRPTLRSPGPGTGPTADSRNIRSGSASSQLHPDPAGAWPEPTSGADRARPSVVMPIAQRSRQDVTGGGDARPPASPASGSETARILERSGRSCADAPAAPTAATRPSARRGRRTARRSARTGSGSVPVERRGPPPRRLAAGRGHRARLSATEQLHPLGRMSRRASRPRWMRDLTVPSDTPVISAISP